MSFMFNYNRSEFLKNSTAANEAGERTNKNTSILETLSEQIRNFLVVNTNLREVYEDLTQENVNEISNLISPIYYEEFKEGSKVNFQKNSLAKLICDQPQQMKEILSANQSINNANLDKYMNSIKVICDKIIPNMTENQRKHLNKDISTSIINDYMHFDIVGEKSIKISIPNTINLTNMDQIVQKAANNINGINIEKPTRGRKPANKDAANIEHLDNIAASPATNKKSAVRG